MSLNTILLVQFILILKLLPFHFPHGHVEINKSKRKKSVVTAFSVKSEKVRFMGNVVRDRRNHPAFP